MGEFRKNRGSSGPMNRRTFLGGFGGAAAAVAMVSVGKSAMAGPGWSRPGVSARLQEGSPEAMAAPTLGPQADGTNLWRVTVGSMDMGLGVEYLAFLPGEITVNAGDSIWFDNGPMPGFHTVTFPGPAQIPPIFVPDPGATPVADQPPTLILNPEVIFPVGGSAVDGSAYVNSGVVIFGDLTVPLMFSFPTAGTYDMVCIPHQGVMIGKVTVQEAGAALPQDQAAVDAAAMEQLAALQETATQQIAKYDVPATSTANADGTTTWGATAGAGEMTQARIQRFFPAEMTIKVGDTVTWTNQAPGEPHTITFVGSDETPPEDVMVVPNADGTATFVQNNLTLLPQGNNTFDGTGYANSGWIGVPPVSPAMDWSCTFTAPGEFTYYCVLHGDATGQGMAAKLIVTA